MELIKKNLKILGSYEYDNKMFAVTESEHDDDNFGFSVSQDSSIFVFGSSLKKREKRKQLEDYQFLVFNKEMEILDKRQTSFGLMDDEIDVKDFEINNDGVVWVTTKSEKKTRIFKVSKGSDAEMLEFYPEGTYVKSTALFHTTSGDFYVVGYCLKSLKGNSKKQKIPTDFFISKFNKKGDSIFEKILPLSDDEDYSEAKENSDSKKNRDYANMVIKNVLINYNAKTINVASEHTKRIKLNEPKGNQRKINWETGEITMTSFSFEGDYNWSTDVFKVSRHNPFFNFKGVSYSFGYDSKGGMMLLYSNIKEKTYEVFGKEITTNSSEMYVEGTYINKEGKIEDQRTLYVSKKRFYFDSSVSKKVGHNAILIYCNNNNRMKLGLLTYN
jgi:hypothetical protein